MRVKSVHMSQTARFVNPNLLKSNYLLQDSRKLDFSSNFDHLQDIHLLDDIHTKLQFALNPNSALYCVDPR